MKVYIDKSDLTQVLDVVSRGKKEVYVLVDNSGKNENALHFLDLAEHDKQVRKEVVQEIRQKVEEKVMIQPEDEWELEYEFCYKEDLDEILDKVEKSCKN